MKLYDRRMETLHHAEQLFMIGLMLKEGREQLEDDPQKARPSISKNQKHQACAESS